MKIKYSAPPFSGDAVDVDIADSGGYYTGTEVETALQEIGAGTTLDSRYVNVTGDTMTGDLTMNGGNIVMSGAETVDGIDISAHAADASAHHAPVTPGGSDTQVQFNDGGSFGGDAGFVYNKTNDTVTIDGANSQRLILKANASQSVDLFQAQNSSGTATAGVNSDGILFSDQSGQSNVYIGPGAGSTQSGANFNIGVGSGTLSSLNNSAADLNIGIGRNAGNSITSGNSNAILGGLSGGTITTGNFNTIIGRSADISSGTVSEATVIGFIASVSGNTGTAIGSRSSAGSRAVAVGDSSSVSGLGSVAIGRNATASGPTSVAIGQDSSNNFGNAVAIGDSATIGANSSMALGAGATTTDGSQLVFGGSTVAFRFVYFGSGVTDTSPKDSTLNATGGSGTDINAADLTIAGGRGTGTGTGGDIIFETAAPGTTGSSLNSLLERMRITDDTEIVINDPGNDFDFRVESDNVTNVLKVDAGNDQVETHGGRIVNITTVNAATYDLLATDHIVHVTYTSTGAVTSLTLPTAQVVSGRVITIKDAGGSADANNITVDTQGAETIDGSATAIIDTNYASINLYSDGSNWFIY